MIRVAEPTHLNTPCPYQYNKYPIPIHISLLLQLRRSRSRRFLLALNPRAMLLLPLF